jgi:hypothetical protein
MRTAIFLDFNPAGKAVMIEDFILKKAGIQYPQP